MEKEILEGNKLIAIFMGGKLLMNNIYNFPVSFGYKESYDEGGYIGSGKSSVWDIDEMEYHTSWDWLIPVYNKILALFNSDNELLKKLKENRLILNCVKTVLDASDVSLQIEIYSSFLKVCDIIKWYNSTQKP